MIGSFVHFTGCYLKSVNLTVENSFNLEGYPHNVLAKVSFEAMDTSFVNFDGSFMGKKLGNQAIVVDGFVRDAVQAAEKTLQSGSNWVTGKFTAIEEYVKNLK
jgi:hypothetical protein